MIYFGQDKMSEFYYGGTEIKEMYLGSTKVFQNKHPLFLTLETDGHGTLTADVLSGFEGDTVTLSPTYNTYYRFSGYDCTGGTIAGNTFTFGQEDATAKANFKVNAFTASGNFEKGSDVNLTALTYSNESTANVPTKYAVHVAHTGDIPAAWYSTSNRWKVTTAPSAYQITLNPKMTFQAKFQVNWSHTGYYAKMTACSLIGSTVTQSQTFNANNGNTALQSLNYNKSFTSNSTGVNYGISGKISKHDAYNNNYGRYFYTSAYYKAAQTTGTWTATGYAP